MRSLTLSSCCAIRKLLPSFSPSSRCLCPNAKKAGDTKKGGRHQPVNGSAPHRYSGANRADPNPIDSAIEMNERSAGR